MATIPASYAQLTIPFSHAGLSRAAACVFGVLVTSDPSSASELADACFDRFIDNCGGLIDNQVVVGPAHVAWNDGSGIFSGDGANFSSGGLSDTTCNPNTAVLIKKSTAAPGRAGRGRTYLPWAATEASVDEVGNFDSAAAAVVTAAFEDWRADQAADSNLLVVLHAGAGTPAAITAFTCDLRVATQRRRLR